ncbi:MAG: NAD-dependent DNA ligase LigA [Spirochaetaceae bacterium]|jgi:DNA ligase (NAD+)|nr:NAD-dependent DNA ligase LigA [Spirochaetaceae bacterium]
MTIKELEATILRYQEAYYSGEGLVSDAEFDALWDELSRRKSDSPVLKAIGSERTGHDHDNIDGFPKARHIIPMGSQEKAANEADFFSWAKKLSLSAFVVQFKLDGASLELQYEKGKLIRAVTRGDGITGADITPNVVKMCGVVHELDLSWTGGVRGEVVMFHNVWHEKYTAKANCRNAANGLMRRKDGKGAQDLTLISYDASAAGDDMFFTTETAKIAWLEERGFYVSPSCVFNTAEEVIAYRTKIAKERSALPYDIDGLVVKDPVTDAADLRKTRPERQIAFKFELEQAVSTLRDIEWSESGATYTPIGIIDPVRLAGTTVKRANLNNPATIRMMGLEIGSRVIIVKRGEIIPKIEGIMIEDMQTYKNDTLRQSSDSLFSITIPTVCGICGTALVDAGSRLYCPNTACPKRLLHRLEKWASVLDIAELGTKLITQLFERGRIRQVSDLYTLEISELAEYERMGDLSAAKVVRNIKTPREITFPVFIAGFDIEGIGETIMEKVAGAGFNTLPKLRAASAEELAAIYGLGDITAQTIVDGLAETAADMDAVLANGIISLARLRDTASLPLAGKSFCFTGELNSMKRSEAEAQIKTLGGTTKTSVVKGLSYLVTNTPESGSSKNKKAKNLGIDIIDETAFLDLLKTQLSNNDQ